MGVCGESLEKGACNAQEWCILFTFICAARFILTPSLRSENRAFFFPIHHHHRLNTLKQWSLSRSASQCSSLVALILTYLFQFMFHLQMCSPAGDRGKELERVTVRSLAGERVFIPLVSHVTDRSGFPRVGEPVQTLGVAKVRLTRLIISGGRLPAQVRALYY